MHRWTYGFPHLLFGLCCCFPLQILLYTMHKYELELVVAPAGMDTPFKIKIPDTTFMAVTSYQNIQVGSRRLQHATAYKFLFRSLRHCSAELHLPPLPTHLQLTQLKIDNNPFAKGFRDRDMAVLPRPPAGCNRRSLPLWQMPHLSYPLPCKSLIIVSLQ